MQNAVETPVLDGGPAELIDFASFVASLATSALVHLGESAADPAQDARPDVASARQLIEVLGMLQEKTRGNLTKEEQALMENVLYDLRLKFLRVAPAR